MTRVLGEDWLLPGLDDSNRAWFTSGQLSVRACTSCGALQFPPEDVCGACQGFEFKLQPCRGQGRIESFIVVHHPVHPALKDVGKYAVVLVSLDDAPGVNIVGNVVGSAPEDLAIGQGVRVVFEEVTDPDTGDLLKIPQWELAAD
jgi:uncharacterized OB-fold protein